MARTFTLVCDGCGRKSTEKAPVEQIRLVRSDGSSWVIDLCGKCFGDLADRYHAQPVKKQARSSYEVTSVEEIQKRSKKP